MPVFLAAFVRLPYYLISPGEARGVGQLIKVADNTPVYEPEGQILFTTVSLTSQVNVYDALRGWLDDDVEVVPEEDITGGKSRQETRRLNLQLMDDSKLKATKIALEKLDYRVDVEGSGALVTEVVIGSPADKKLELADVIVAVDGQPVSLHDQAVSLVRQHKPGDVINFTVKRGGQDTPVSVEAGSDENGAARVGVVLTTNELKYKFPVDVDIETGLVGGPSAGLAFTLALLDELTPGELTGGRAVAVTGTIEYDGSVGVVGGVAQKAVTARKAGAAIFLVPPVEVEEARKHAGKMQVVGVGTLDEAVNELTRLGGSGLGLAETHQASPPS